MADREKVIKGLDHCNFGSYGPCYEEECPYYQINGCTDELKNDILALLKEQDEIIQRILSEKKDELNNKNMMLQNDLQNIEMKKLVGQK